MSHDTHECFSCGRTFPYTMMPFGGRILECPHCGSPGVLKIPKPTAFHDLPAEKFPLKLECLRSDTREVVWEATVEGPGAVEVPPLRRQFGVPVIARVTFADGEVIEEGPP